MSRKRSKRYLENKKKVSEIKSTSLNDAIKAFKSNKGVKFDETLDISVMLNKEKNKGEGLARGFAQLPSGTGKKIIIAVFATGDKAKEAKEAGADIIGNEDLIKNIKDGKINFDVAVSTPDMMKDIAVLGEKLGPLGIMPNPKTGTVTDNLSKTIKSIKGGQIQFKSVQTKFGALVNNVSYKINEENTEITLEIIEREFDAQYPHLIREIPKSVILIDESP